MKARETILFAPRFNSLLRLALLLKKSRCPPLQSRSSSSNGRQPLANNSPHHNPSRKAFAISDHYGFRPITKGLRTPNFAEGGGLG